MSDRYAELVRNPIGKRVADAAGLPQPLILRSLEARALPRSRPGAPHERRLAGPAPRRDLEDRHGRCAVAAGHPRRPAFEASSTLWTKDGESPRASSSNSPGIEDSAGLKALWNALHPTAKAVKKSGRIVVIARTRPRDRPVRAHRTACARGLHPLARQGDRQGPHGQPRAWCIRRRDGRSSRPCASSSRHARPTCRARSRSSASPSARAPPRRTGTARSRARSRSSPVAARGIGAAIAATLHRDGAEDHRPRHPAAG